MRENRLRGNLFDSYMYHIYIFKRTEQANHHTIYYYLYILGITKNKKGKCCCKHNDNGNNDGDDDDNHPSDFHSFILPECEFSCGNSLERKHKTQCIASKSIISICGRKTFRFLFANGNYFDGRQMFFSSCSYSH